MATMTMNCYRCGRLVDNGKEPLYEIQAISWVSRNDGIGIGHQTGNAYLCEQCADGLEDYLDEYWRKRRKATPWK